jgi:hypothetical protein
LSAVSPQATSVIISMAVKSRRRLDFSGEVSVTFIIFSPVPRITKHHVSPGFARV